MPRSPPVTIAYRPRAYRESMASKRSSLPRVTPKVVRAMPDRVRPTPKGGHAWKCHYCGAYASSETQAGRYVCRRHGGHTPRQRKGEPCGGASAGPARARPPGRPIESGLYSRSPRIPVNEIVGGLRLSLDEVRAADEHMIYLRAHLEHASSQRKDEDEIEDALTILANEGATLCAYLEVRPALLTDDDAHEAIRHIVTFHHHLSHVKREVDAFRRATRQLEKRHERLIRLTKLRTLTSAKYAEAHRIAEVTRIIRGVLHALEPHLDGASSLRLRTGLHRQFATVPTRALTSRALAPIPGIPHRTPTPWPRP